MKTIKIVIGPALLPTNYFNRERGRESLIYSLLGELRVNIIQIIIIMVNEGGGGTVQYQVYEGN